MLWCFLTIITFGIYGWWLEIKMLKWQTKNIHIKTVGEVEQKDNSLWIAIPVAILAILLFSFAVAAMGSVVENADVSDKIEKVFDGKSINKPSRNSSNGNTKVMEQEVR